VKSQATVNGELLQILSESGLPVGTARRAEVHSRGLWHRTVHVWVVVPRGAGRADGALLFQRRSPTKDVAPNLIDVSVGGHLGIGEEPLAAACRELAEELGILAGVDELRPLGVRQTSAQLGSAIDREVQTIFGIEDRRHPDEYRPQAREIACLLPIPVGDGLRLFAGQVEELAVEAGRVLADGNVVPVRERIRADDFVPSVDRYFYRAFVTARRWIRGEEHLAI